MTKLERLEESVRQLYEARNPNRDEWADWLLDNHVFVVADYAEQVANEEGSDPDAARAASVLHDIADTEMARVDERHEDRSLEIEINQRDAPSF